MYVQVAAGNALDLLHTHSVYGDAMLGAEG